MKETPDTKFDQGQNQEGYEVVPADHDQSKKCLIIKQGAAFTSSAEILRLARIHGAIEDSSDEEAGDDMVYVQFPNHPQEMLGQDDLAQRLQELSANE